MKQYRGDADASRRADLAKIHLAKKDLIMDDETYRAVILRLTNGRKSSAADLNIIERQALLAEFQRFGWKPKLKSDTATPLPRQSARRMIWRIRKLAGDRGDAYLDGMAKHMFGLSAFTFATDQQLHSILAALEIDARRQVNRNPGG